MVERKTIHKWFWVWDFEKEERWLNEMAQNGWLLEGVGFAAYHFVKAEPGEYTIRLEMHPADEAYLDFLRSSGVEYIGRCFQWIYLRRPSAEGPFDLFSDIDSKIQHLDRIGKMLFLIGMANLLIGLVTVFNPSRIGWVNLLCCALLMYGLGRIHGKKETLELDRVLHE